jgi:phosphoribosylanthranilate isomerase
VTDIKFCGVTRAADAALAASLGAAYVGCIFAGGPRHQTPDGAAKIFAELTGPRRPRRVGVFATADAALLAPAIEKAGLDVIQLHGDPTPPEIAALRRSFHQQIWAVVRCRGGELPDAAASLWDAADGVLLDARVDGRLGGTGVALPWQALSGAIQDSRARSTHRGRLVLAGGLTADNVGQAIEVLRPDVVDTSSGVELAAGIKDPSRLKAFIQAVVAADRAIGLGPEPSRSM